MPSNFGAYAGKFIDGFNGVSINEVGKYQMGMGFANDLTMFALTGGNGGAMLDAAKGFNGVRYFGTITNSYTIYDYRNTMQSIKKSKLKN